uniref:Putative nucleic acid binding protein n=1 Tax=Trypanosoma vivax (strain Y486) TaxID=1055687 RepID=G0U3D2_TRYVY|nr:putative nucleic acid binding protein [Trypanosoma vivax Y486]
MGSNDYLHPNEELPAYTVVEVVRHVASGRPGPRREREPGPAPSQARQELTKIGFKGDNPDAQLTEEERLARLSEAVAAETGIDEVTRWRARQMRGRNTGAPMSSRDDMFRPPPPGYICHNCGKKGHLIQHCPASNGQKGLKLLSLPTGIPETMLVECTMDDPAAKFLTRDGRLVKRRLDNASFTGIVSAESTSLRSPTVPSGESVSTNGGQGNKRDDASNDGGSDGRTTAAEEKLYCAWDRVLARNAMKAPCCGALFCENCFNEKVEEAISRDDAGEAPFLCPGCNDPLVVPDVVAAEAERATIENLCSRKRTRGL